MPKNLIIVFEGIEGSGKSHHIKTVGKYLKKNKKKFIQIREPGGSSNSEKIRKLILNNNSTFNKHTDLLLYLSARSENVELIKKNIGKKIILIDRFKDSTIAYQHYGMGVNLEFINKINNYLLKDIEINYTFLNTVNKKNLKTRLLLRNHLNRYDKFNSKFYEKVQRGFIMISKKKPKKYMQINSNLAINYNEKIILDKIKDLIKT